MKCFYYLFAICLIWTIEIPVINTQPEIGQRVRIAAPSVGPPPFAGTVEDLSDSVILIFTKREIVPIPVHSIHRLEISKSKSSGLGGALIEGVVPGLLGGFIAHSELADEPPPPLPCEYLICIRKVDRPIITKEDAPSIGLAIGISGALIGWAIDRKQDRWKEQPFNISLGILPSSLD